jgi:hypothetical protein
MVRVSGEAVQEKCEYFIGSDYDINYNPYIKNNLLSKWIPVDKWYLTNYKNANKIFCYTHLLYSNFKELLSILNEILNDFDIYFGNSDANFLEKHFSELSKIKNLRKVYPQNNTVVNQQVITLPIGIANRQWPHGNQECFNFEIIKSGGVFLNFDVHTNATRLDCKNTLIEKGITWIGNNNYQDYLKVLSKHHFCICVEGNGLDTHRFWECLYLKVIPICLKNDWTRTMEGKVPMILLDTWKSLNTDKLEYSWNLNEKILELEWYF